MSYHIYIKNNKEVTFTDLLESNYLPKTARIAYRKSEDEIIQGFSKLYQPLTSSRGVAITKNDDEYDVELNIGASKEDYYLATKIALALSVLNTSEITPEFDESLSHTEFEKKYDRIWAKENEQIGINSLVYLINEESSTVQLSGCKRVFYFGKTMCQELSSDNPSEEEFAARIVEKIRSLQFIEETTTDLTVPTLMEADLPEGVKTMIVVAANFSLLLIKADYIILRNEKDVLKVPYEDFINQTIIQHKLKKVDEEQYIMNSINASEYSELMTIFSPEIAKEERKKTKSWWKFWE